MSFSRPRPTLRMAHGAAVDFAQVGGKSSIPAGNSLRLAKIGQAAASVVCIGQVSRSAA